MINTVRERHETPLSISLSSALCYALGPAGALYFLNFSPYRHIWSVRLHACHSLVMSGLFLTGSLLFAGAEAVFPWFLSALAREARVCAMLGAIPVWLLASIAAVRGSRFAAIPALHEMAVKLARHLEHSQKPGSGSPA